MNRATVVACLVATLSTSCATRGALREVAEDLRAVQSDIAVLRQAQGELSQRLTDVAAATRATEGKTERLQASIAATTAEAARLGTRIEAADEAIRQVKEAAAAHAAATPPPPPSAPAPPKETRAGSAESAYAAGMASFRGREYGQAVLDFLDVVTKHPAHPLAPTAQYWIGEAYYLQHDYRQALVEFQRVVDWEGPSPKAAEALVKTGLCYGSLREATRAQQAWRRVLREFPESEAAEQARSLLAEKGPASPSRRP